MTFNNVIALSGCALLLLISVSTTSAQEIKLENALVTLIDAVEISAGKSGRIDIVKKSEGDRVSKDDVLATIDARSAELKRDRAKIDHEMAKTNALDDINIRFSQKSLEVARAELKRAISTNKRFANTVSQAELDRLELLFQKAELELEKAKKDQRVLEFTRRLREKDLQIAEQELIDHKLISPIDGVVVGIEKKKGEWIDESQIALKIVRTDRLRVEGFLHVSKALGVKKDRKCTFHFDDGKRQLKFPGTVTFVNPDANPVNSEVKIWAEIQNADSNLLPGLRGTLILHEEVDETSAE